MFSAPADDPWANKADDDDEWDTDPDFENQTTITSGTKDTSIVSAAEAQRRLREQLDEENSKKFGVPKQVAVEKNTAHLGNLGEKPAPARPWQQQQTQSQPPVVVSSSSQQVNPVSAARSQFSQPAAPAPAAAKPAPAPVRSFGAPAAAPPAAKPAPTFAAAPPPAAKPAPAPAPVAAPPPAAKPPPPPASSKPPPPPAAAKPQAAPPVAAPPPPAPAQIYEEPAASYDDSSSYDQGGYQEGGYDDGSSYDQGGYQEGGYDGSSYDQGGYQEAGYDQSGYDQSYNQGYDQGYDQSGYDQGHAAQGGKQCRALYDFAGENETDLAFYEGSIITIINDTDPSGWWEGELNGVVGYFPSNFVELI